jgi:hypothetical protein
MPRTACNPFVFRQTPDSKFSHFQPTDPSRNPWTVLEQLVDLISSEKEQVVQLNHEDTVRKVTIPMDADLPGQFFSAVVEVDGDTDLLTTFALRPNALPGEQPFIQTVAVGGRKAPARRVEIILYHVSALKPEERIYTPEGTSQPVVVDAEWQIISINCQATDEAEPPTPQAIARNMAAKLGLPEGIGGTARDYTAEELMRSILYWSRRTMCAGS